MKKSKGEYAQRLDLRKENYKLVLSLRLDRDNWRTRALAYQYIIQRALREIPANPSLVNTVRLILNEAVKLEKESLP